jgi:hypothetical protein
MPRTRHSMPLLATLTLVTACAAPAWPDTSEFQHDVQGGPRPWKHEHFDNARDKFTFALFSDLTGSERDGVFEVAVAQLRLLRPELILCVGDLIEGETEDRDELAREWDSFERREAATHAPVFHVGGNHDLSNPVMWEVWEERHGRRYYHFVYRNVLFLVLDTEDNPREVQQGIHEIQQASMEIVEEQGWGALDSTPYGQLEERRTGRVGAAQAEYFRGVIADHPGVRWTFLFMHKPAWQRPGEENFATVEATLAGRPYTVFYGHEHAYGYERRHGRDYIRLGTTGGVLLPENGMAVDHVTLVTVSDTGVDIANLRLSGIFDKTGRIPLNGEELCFEFGKCD